jgi:protein required for attachment to host cells
MPKPNIWVLVADAARARVFHVERPNMTLAPALGRELIGPRLQSREIASDRPGRTFDRAGEGRHAKEPPTDPARHAKGQFAHDLAGLLDDERKQGSFDRLIIVAAPQFLGDLRNVMSKQLRDLVADEIAKDLSKLPPQELQEHLGDVLAQQSREG